MDYKKQTFLVVGGAGLIGSATAKYLVEQGASVVVADIRPPEKSKGHTSYRQVNILDENALGKIIEECNPDVIINAVNVATLFSRHPHQGYDQLVAFYIDLYRSLRALQGSIHYIQVGTTGSGGLGFNIPFTHGDKLEDLPIINKAAFAGVTTSMLTLLSRSFDDQVRVSELKPGLAIFAMGLHEVKVEGVTLVTIDGGESGHYTYNEMALLTQFMGFTQVSEIVEKLMAIHTQHSIEKKVSAFDIIENINQTIIAPDPQDIATKQAVLTEMRERQGLEYIIATGNLGPPSVTRDLILGYLLSYAEPCRDSLHFSECLEAQPCVRATVAYIKGTNAQLYHYLRSECSYHNYELLRHYWRQGVEPWQIAGASLSKTSPAY